MKQDVRLIKLLRLVLLLLAFCLSAMTLTGGGTAEAAPQRITMSIEQWNQFKNQTNLLEAKLSRSRKGAWIEILCTGRCVG